MAEPRPRQIKRFGWVPDLPDARDHLYAAPPQYLTNLPAKADLRDGCPKEIYDQGQLGSCTGNGWAAAVEFLRMKQGLTDFTPSRLFIYYNERVEDGDVPQDAGAAVSDGADVVSKIGCPDEL